MDFTKFSDHLKNAIQIAEEAAERFGSSYIGSEHILYGILCEGESAGGRLCLDMGVDVSDYRNIFKRNIDYNLKITGLYTPRTKNMFEMAKKLCALQGGTLTGTEHMLLAILDTEGSLAVKILEMLGTDVHELIRKTQEVIGDLAAERPFSKGYNAEVRYRKENAESQEAKPRARKEEESGCIQDEMLLQYGIDLTRRAREGKLDPVIGRRKEIDKVIQILSRRTKNNPVLIGEPGVGKSAVVEGLAQAIVSGEVPELLRDKFVYSLNLNSLLAGARYRGDFEERMKDLMDSIVNNKHIILFIDEIHMIVGAGSSAEGNMDASNILKPMLARGEMQTIGATTLEEYRKYIEKDSALERRFTPVTVDQPSVEDTIVILRGLKDKYEAHHNVVITDEAIEAAAKLSDRYITDRFLPDKAIDLIDEAASRERLDSYNGPSGLHEMEEKLERLNAEKTKAARWEQYARADELSKQAEQLQEEITRIKKEWNDKRNSMHLSIGTEEIAEIVSGWTGVPVAKLTEGESEKLMHLEEELHKRIVGQEEAVAAVSRAIRRARAGLKDPNKPVGSFIFVGPTGVGKTDLCKALAECMFGDERLMIRLDMSEYMEKHSVSKLIGAPPGYVGYDEGQGGQLTERIRRKPYSVVLFDEIEKAHPDVFNVLLQILDDGRLTDSKGRVVSFKNTVLIMTSNVGAHEVKETAPLGFRSSDEESEYEDMRERITDALKAQFRPEFLNRLDEVIVFHKLRREEAAQICEKILSSLEKQLGEREMHIRVSERAKNKLVEEGYSEEFGARPLKRVIQKLVSDRLSEEILTGRIATGSTVIIDEEEGKLTFTQE
ncbi:MAG: ATP-dependent Clp protease ATP-binding subunit [Clostridia bacterium]|nr:ATP-dependent Clp protease ATP-binding subunit [Clostridia bacterium]